MLTRKQHLLLWRKRRISSRRISDWGIICRLLDVWIIIFYIFISVYTYTYLLSGSEWKSPENCGGYSKYVKGWYCCHTIVSRVSNCFWILKHTPYHYHVIYLLSFWAVKVGNLSVCMICMINKIPNKWSNIEVFYEHFNNYGQYNFQYNFQSLEYVKDDNNVGMFSFGYSST